MNATRSSSTANTHPTTPVANSACQEPLPCPRCNSHDTKFCYYNNYNLTQPRHYCRACRRYWTQGGTLRNVPVGGGCRKNKQVVPTDPSKFILQPSTTTTPFTVWNPNAKSNTSLPVLNSQVPGMAHNGFQLIPSEAVPAQPFQVDMPEFGIEEMDQYVGGYAGNMDAFGDGYESYDSNAEFGSVSGVIPINGSEFGYWNPGSAWTDYPATNSAFH